MKKLVMLLPGMLLAICQLMAQGRVITGTVTDAAQGTPLTGVSVFTKDAKSGTLTDDAGRYSLRVTDNDRVLVFTFVGYAQQEVKLGAENVLNVSLGSDESKLQEVVVVGYGKQIRREVTGALSRVSGKDIENVPLASFDQMLQGKVPGLQVVSTSGQPGAATNVRLRGIGSISAGAAPLYVVDGIPLVIGDNSSLTTTANSLAGINPNDIEDISVLKDASATSIYGSRAANGVILITTKKGRAGKTRIRIDAEAGFNKLALAETARPLTTMEYYELTLEGLANRFGGEPRDYVQDFLDVWAADTTKNVDWIDLISQTGKQQQYNISLQGGNENTQFFLSGGFFRQDGVVIKSGFERTSLNMNLTTKAGKNITIGAGLNLTKSLQQTPNNSGGFSNPVAAAFFLLPFAPPYDDDGKPNIDPTYYGVSYNPLAIAEWDYNRYNNLKGLSSIYGEWKILNNLKFTSRYGLDYQDVFEKLYWNPLHGDGVSYEGYGFSNSRRIWNWIWSNTLDYKVQPFKSANIVFDLKAGYEAQEQRDDVQELSTNTFPLSVEQKPELVLGAAPQSASTYYDDWAIQSVFGSMNVNLFDRFNVYGSYRRDGSSRFGINKRYGNFWSAGAAWNIDREAFMNNLSWVSSLKLRGSYGVNGNADIGNYEWKALYSYGVNYNLQTGTAPSDIGNFDLTWELNKPLDIGIDLGVLNERVTLSFDWYRRVSSALLLDLPLSLTSGFATTKANVGRMENKGIEVDLNVSPVRNRTVRWDIGLNMARNKNKILELLPGQDSYVDGSFIRKVGMNFQTWYTRLYAGVDPQTGDALWYKDATRKETTTDYGEAERVEYNAAQPKMFGSFNNSVSYKGISLMAQLNYQFGGYIRDGFQDYTKSDGFDPFENRHSSQLRRWQKPGDITDVPKYVFNNSSQSNAFSSRFIYKSDFLRLRTITLAYDLPAEVLSKFNIASVKFYARALNLFTKTYDKNLDFDPDAGGINGINDLNMFPLKSMTVGINIGL